MSRELKFNLTIDSTALYCPNAQEFYSKCYIDDNLVENFRTIPGIKNSTEIANTSFSNILKASSCDFSAGDQTLATVAITVKPVSALAEMCRFDLETSFLSQSMAAGSNSSFEVSEFMTYYWDELAKEIKSELSQIAWKGDTANAAYSGTSAYLKLVDGFEKQLLADATVLDVAATSITVSNVLAEMDKVYDKYLTGVTACDINDEDLRWYVSADVYGKYLRATAAGNTLSYVTKQLDPTYLNIKLVPMKGMTANRMVLTNKSNLIYAFDGLGDAKELKAVNLEDTVAEPKLRTRVNLKAGFKIINGDQIVYYNA